jgi:Fic family protein
MLLAFIVIAIGFHGVLEEFDHKQSMRALRKVDESLRQLGEWIEKANLFMRSISERHELRIHNLDTKRSLAERKFEKKAKELSKRIINLENKLNSVKKSLAPPKAKPPTKMEKRFAKAISILRKEGMINIPSYAKRIGVGRKVAVADLSKMTAMGIVRKRGRGRNIYYTLRF